MKIVAPKKVRLIETNPDKLTWKAINQKRDRLIDEVKKDVERLLDDERKRVATAIRGAVNYYAMPKLAAAQVREKDYLDLLLGTNIQVAQVFRDDTLERAGLPTTKASFDALVSQYVAQHVAERVRKISSTSRDAIKTITDEAIKEGLSIPNTAKLIDDLYLEQLIPNRSKMIARTEVISSSNAGSYLAAKSTNIPMKKRWLATGDKRTRDAHASANGQTVDIDGFFIVGGERLKFPGDSSLGASGDNVVACRCTVTYQID